MTWSTFLWQRKKKDEKKRKEKKSRPGSSRPCTEDRRRQTTVSISFFAALVYSGRRQPRSSPGPNRPGGARARFFRFVTAPRGKTTKAVFIDVRGAAKEDVFIGLSMLVSLFFMLFVTRPSSFYISSRVQHNTTAHSRHPAAGDTDHLLVLNRLER